MAGTHRERRRHPHPGVVRAREQRRAGGRAAAGDGRRRRVRPDRHQAPCGLRLVGGRPRGARPHRGRPGGRRPVPRRPGRPRRDAHPAVLRGLRHPVPGDVGRRARDGWRPHRRGAVGVGDVGRGDARGVHPPRRPGHGRGSAGARHHRAVRQGPPPVRQAARGVPGHRPLPGRCGDGRRRGDDPRPRGGVGLERRPVDARPWRRWPSCSPARPTATSRPWPNRSSAASASPSSSTSSCTSGAPSNCRSRGGTRATSRTSWPRPCSTARRAPRARRGHSAPPARGGGVADGGW